MKKSKKTLVTCLMLLFIFSLKASDEMNLKISENENLIVEMKKTEPNAILSLLNQEGEVIFKDRFFGDSIYTRKLKFEELPDGEYTLVLDKTFSTSNSVIKKSKAGLELGLESVTFKPTFKIEGQKVNLYLANPEQLNLYVQIFDSEGVEVGNFRCKDQVMKKTLDFSRVPAGSYTVKVKTPQDEFTKEVEI
ncbi:hypothetical protein MKO06_10335 [Gramella sp. GC03-9]|uniref:Por secretion system C-terminal sorting domain-containing protein n=1 Tax=Christiangramia oceanisediminis TaxID=2920386 RepID=A0A9X2KXV5_9FLAO|nr:hypothetical protein [Gramella oceanisediminis]MCP9200308.1 hypothetical protein [Gramella oceanisediminis]